MPADTDAEIVRLKTVLRDLVALAAIPAMWVGSEPAAVTTGLADALVGLLRLDFAFVRLRDPSGAGAAEATSGNTWSTYREWLDRVLPRAGRSPGARVVPWAGDSAATGRAVVLPVGADGDGGVVVAGSTAPEFPTDIDQLLVGLAANHAATAFQNARLVHERMIAAVELRRARDDLEMKVAERTAELEASRVELAASRARIVAAADQTRRRIERDLHDGVQQRLVSLAMAQAATQASIPAELAGLSAQMSAVAEGLAATLEELQELSRGIHPAILARGGLRAALKPLARRSSVPVELDLRVATRLPEKVEVAAYYIVSEAITNATKHAHASVMRVVVEAGDGVLALSIEDDGRGGADATRGSGLTGLADRVDALGGEMQVVSPPGEGTVLRVTLPVDIGAP